MCEKAAMPAGGAKQSKSKERTRPSTQSTSIVQCKHTNSNAQELSIGANTPALREPEGKHEDSSEHKHAHQDSKTEAQRMHRELMVGKPATNASTQRTEKQALNHTLAISQCPLTRVRRSRHGHHAVSQSRQRPTTSTQPPARGAIAPSRSVHHDCVIGLLGQSDVDGAGGNDTVPVAAHVYGPAINVSTINQSQASVHLVVIGQHRIDAAQPSDPHVIDALPHSRATTRAHARLALQRRTHKARA